MPPKKKSDWNNLIAWQDKDVIKEMRKAGILTPADGIDLRKKLTTGQKSKITRRYKKHSLLVRSIVTDAPRTKENKKLTKRRVSKKTAKQMGEMGFMVVGQNVWINKEDATTIKIRKGKLIMSDPEKSSVTHFGDAMTKEGNILAQLEKMAKTKLPLGTYVTVRIGDGGLWKKYFSYRDLLKYLSGWQPNNPNADRDNLISRMEIVTYHT